LRGSSSLPVGSAFGVGVVPFVVTCEQLLAGLVAGTGSSVGGGAGLVPGLLSFHVPCSCRLSSVVPGPRCPFPAIHPASRGEQGWSAAVGHGVSRGTSLQHA
jgi:hypothetical protein